MKVDLQLLWKEELPALFSCLAGQAVVFSILALLIASPLSAQLSNPALNTENSDSPGAPVVESSTSLEVLPADEAVLLLSTSNSPAL